MDVEQFIVKWRVSGGNERANTQLFVTDLAQMLGVDAPQPTQSDTALNDYVFERYVVKREIDGTESSGWIDCYKRDHFILEAKQGSAADIAAVDAQAGDSRRDLFGQTAAERFKRGMAKRGTGQWTGAMQRAAGQAAGYAKALPTEHGWPPFLLVSDIGHCIDVYARFERDGKEYAPFPDRRRFRITLEDLRDEAIRDRLRAIWTAPLSLDPSAEAARVTRGVAAHLAELARGIEARTVGTGERNADAVAAYLMRLLFTMFAEDTGLIPKKSFSALLTRVRERPENLAPQLTALWAAMDTGGFVGALGEAGETVRRFNGYLFKDTSAIPLTTPEIDVLIEAAKADWRQVEPAIFGTLLERALNPKERAKLGAHYTPRAYVERLVGPTIIEPLREDWLGARTAATEAAERGDREAARGLVEAFHTKLANTKVLDPACGTGNFLYVAMARMKELEGEVLELLEELDDERYLSELGSHTITPANFLGIEINPRAAAIAQLVLWIGYLQWHFRVNGEERMPEPPVLRDVKTIENRDALIEWDRLELERDQYGRPVTRWDGETFKKHPVTGKDVPDDAARAEVHRYVNPRAAKWPRADFIIGNPPFIGNKRMRDQLGDGYFEALRRAHQKVRGDADLVFYWWRTAAALVAQERVRRAGLITTNTLSQSSGSAIIAEALGRLNPVSLLFAIKDHPWRDLHTDAAVRVSMTVVGPGRSPGQALKVHPIDAALLETRVGVISADLSLGVDVTAAKPLRSNAGMSFMGVKLAGDGFRLSSEQRALLASAGVPEAMMPLLVAGSDVTGVASRRYVLDAFGLSEARLRDEFPAAYQHLYNAVRPGRQQLKRASYRDLWWVFAEPRPRMRRALDGLPRWIATSEVAKHRVFTFAQRERERERERVLPDGSVIVVSSDDALMLGLLSSRPHVLWSLRAAGTLEDRPRYQNSVAFDPFPFPDIPGDALRDRIRDAAEKLDALRKQVLAAHPDLTLTKLYNTLDALRAAEAAGGVLDAKAQDVAARGCVSLIRQYHDEIDAAVAEAYDWPADLPDEEVLERLVALNKERAAEEAGGKVRWLRPEFQAPGYVAPAEQVAMPLAEAAKPSAEILEWPGALPEQVVAVAGVVERAARPVAANDVARAFRGKRAATVAPVLDALAGMGRLRKLGDGRYAA
ncbi:class I SAM-dependent DNA methyltransferase [Sphingomonas lenta]|uniref:site-specific DNA-methyltransferase (adenine-specific) n=1 Tax=Sphingomonas lenta TaxID=1141887 RepID=A0A2A2SJ10_9SPHN|nr:DNA methyltransferase [Sphingomonas lenta]PAX09205.1 SAM-dependent methyltransferase [Sphingomonas lenta]